MKGKTTKKGKTPKAISEEMPVSVFLKKEMVESGDRAIVYDIVDEFKATKKNSGRTTYISLAVFALLLLLGTFFVTSGIEQRNRTIAIDITDFEDINMQELLNSLRNAGKLMADMKENMAQMKGKMDNAIYNVRVQAEQDLVRLRQQHNISETQRAARMKQILAERDRRMAQVNTEYEAKLKEKERSIENVKVQMSGYKVQLQDTMDACTGMLEKKLKQYQSETKVTQVQAAMMVRQMSVDHEQKRLDEKNQYEKELRELAEKMKKTENALKALSGRTDELDSLLGLYRRSLMHYAFMRGEQGHVLCVQKDGSLLVVLNPLVELKKPCRGMVINSRGAVIAKVNIAPKEGMAKASIIRKIANVPVSPFDMVVVEK